MAEATGLSAVLADATADRGLVPDDAEQLDLLAAIGVHTMASGQPRPPGRPKGAINRRTERVAEYLLAKYPDPLEGLLQMASLGIEEMRAALGCTRMEAFAEKRLCLIAALPYVHRRMPIAVDFTAQSVVHLAIHTGAEGGAGEGQDPGVTLLGTVMETESDQGVSEVSDASV